MPKTYDIAIIIPAYNEANKIARDIAEAAEFISSQNWTGQIIVVDDGSTDSTADKARAETAAMPSNIFLEVISLPHNTGKGAAVRRGILAANARFVMFADSGSCINFRYILKGIELLETGADIAHASRKLTESCIQIPQPIHRRVISYLFKKIIQWYMKIPPRLTDTQCGFKIYRGDIAKQLYSKCKTNGFMFDIEIIARAIREDLRIEEFPVEWFCDRDSRLSIRRSFWSVLKELRQIKKNLKD